MDTLADYIGEDKVNLALHNFLMQYRYANAHNQVDAADSTRGTQSVDVAYPDMRMLADALRAQTPPEYQYLIDDGFNRIVLYNDKALSANSKKLPNGKFEVTLDVQAKKAQSDANGVETPRVLAD
jgi:ABC-2 type transport system permease protein